MRILLTGATGFLGKHLLNELLLNSTNCLAVLIRNPDKLQFLNFGKRLKVISINGFDWKSKVKDFKPEIVIHFAGFLTSFDDENSIAKLIEGNIFFGCNLLDALKNTDLKYFINTGTSTEYRTNTNQTDPAYLYAATKTAFRSILSYYQPLICFKTVNVIPYTIYGENDTQKKLIDYIYQSAFEKNPINMSPGEQVLDFIHINDVVAFYIKLINNINNITESYTELALGTSIGTTPKQLATVIELLLNKKANINWGGVPYRNRDTMYSVADLKQTFRLLNWEPKIKLNEGIEMYINNKKLINNGIQKPKF